MKFDDDNNKNGGEKFYNSLDFDNKDKLNANNAINEENEGSLPTPQR